MSEFALESTVIVVIFLVIFVLVTIFASNIGAGISEALRNYISGSSATDDTTHHAISSLSLGTVGCAMSMVANGKTDACLLEYLRPGGLVASGVTTNVIGEGWLSYSGEVQSGQSAATTDPKPISIGGKSGITTTYEIPSEDRSWIECNGKDGAVIKSTDEIGKPISSCTVHKFSMPQYVSNAENYIPDYGDPRYLMYYNTFPVGEDTWEFDMTEWSVQAGIALLTIAPPTKLAGIGLRTLWARLGNSVSKEMTKKLLAKILKGRYLSRVGTIFASEAEAASAAAREAERLAASTSYSGFKSMLKAEGITSSEWAMETAKQASKDMLASRLSSKGLKKLGALEASAYVMQLAENVNSKYEPVGNNLALKVNLESLSASNKPETSSLPSEWKGPVLLKSVPEVWDFTYKPFYLASPCYIDSLDVKTESVLCSSYSSDFSTGISECIGEKQSDGSQTECGSWGASISRYLGEQEAYQKLDLLMKSADKKLFGVSGADGLRDRAYFPMLDVARVFVKNKNEVTLAIRQSGIYMDLANFRRLDAPAGTTDLSNVATRFSVALYSSSGGAGEPVKPGQAEDATAYLAAKALECFVGAENSGTGQRCFTIDTSAFSSNANEAGVRSRLESGGAEGQKLLGSANGKSLLSWDYGMQFQQTPGVYAFVSSPIIPGMPNYVEIYSTVDNSMLSRTVSVHIAAGSGQTGSDQRIGESTITCEVKDDAYTGSCTTSISSDASDPKIYETPVKFIGVGGGSAYASDPPFLTAVAMVYGPAGSAGSKMVTYFYDFDEDGSWNDIGASTTTGFLYDIGLGSGTTNSLILNGVGGDGSFNGIRMTNCRTNSIVVDATKFKGRNEQKDGKAVRPNYCFKYMSGTSKAISVVSTTAKVLTAVAAVALVTMYTSGIGTPEAVAAAMSMLTYGATASAASELTLTYKQTWPGPS